MNRVKALTRQGQAVWLDYIRRDILENGTLEALVRDDGVSGVTSNPAIFQKAIGESELYDEEIRGHLEADPEIGVSELYERLAVRDIRRAADILRPVYERLAGGDGFVSLEVSPHLARDTGETVREARRLWERVERPNLMIKVPATPEGLPAVETLLGEGINVNITLMFSLDHYEAVARAYLEALESAPEPARLGSVASFFVSRVDTEVDRRLEELGSDQALGLRGRIGIANSKMAYRRFRELFHGEPFRPARARGARVQRVLWASTSTKNPDYRDVLYVEELIGPETVNTVPPSTLEAFREHGEAAPTLERGWERAAEDLRRLADLGVDLDEVTEKLQREGVEKFSQPFDRLLETLAQKSETLRAGLAAESAN